MELTCVFWDGGQWSTKGITGSIPFELATQTAGRGTMECLHNILFQFVFSNKQNMFILCESFKKPRLWMHVCFLLVVEGCSPAECSEIYYAPICSGADMAELLQTHKKCSIHKFCHFLFHHIWRMGSGVIFKSPHEIVIRVIDSLNVFALTRSYFEYIVIRCGFGVRL